MANERDFPAEGFKAYEDGKHRRYSLLFAVNGGAFAVATKLFSNTTPDHLVGNLTLRELSFGMIVFTGIMTFDIFMFGYKMRRDFLPKVFSWEGKLVLVLIGALICAGWCSVLL